MFDKIGSWLVNGWDFIIDMDIENATAKDCLHIAMVMVVTALVFLPMGILMAVLAGMQKLIELMDR